MRIAASTFSFNKAFDDGRLSLDSYMDACAAMGLDAVEFNDGYIEREDADPRYLRRRAATLGLDVAALAIELVFIRANEDELQREEEKLRRWLEWTQLLGCPILRVNTGQPQDRIKYLPDAAMDRAALSNWAVAAFRRLMPAAERLGIVVAMENHFGLTATSRETIAFVDRVGSEWMRIKVDTGNFIHPDWARFGTDWRNEPGYFGRAPMQEDIYEGIERLAPHMVYSHVKIYGLSESGLDDIYLDYDRVLNVFRKVGYRGYLSIENFSVEDPLVLIPRAVRMLRGKLSQSKGVP